MSKSGLHPVGAKVVWEPSNRPGTKYAGCVVAHVASGENIYGVPGYEARRAGKAKPKVGFDRVVVCADHDDKWHAQPVRSLQPR